MSDENKLTGGCMCGAVRFETNGTPLGVGHCHCQSCRRHNGAAVATLAWFTVNQVTFSGDKRNVYRSSPSVGRAFCGRCGTPLTWEGDGGEPGPIIAIHIGTFENPAILLPTDHAFEAERIPWFDISDSLPRYEGLPGNSPLLRCGPISRGLP